VKRAGSGSGRSSNFFPLRGRFFLTHGSVYMSVCRSPFPKLRTHARTPTHLPVVSKIPKAPSLSLSHSSLFPKHLLGGPGFLKWAPISVALWSASPPAGKAELVEREREREREREHPRSRHLYYNQTSTKPVQYNATDRQTDRAPTLSLSLSHCSSGRDQYSGRLGVGRCWPRPFRQAAITTTARKRARMVASGKVFAYRIDARTARLASERQV
jgi:hypothetical protein